MVASFKVTNIEFWHTVKAKGEVITRKTRNLQVAGFNCSCKRARYLFSFSKNIFRSETVHLLLSIILESFKLCFFVLTSNTCDEYFSVHKLGPMLQAVKQSPNRVPETCSFGQFFIVCGGLKNCLALSQNSNVWPPNIHVWTHFEPIFPLRVHGWVQTTVSQLAGERGCRRKRQLLVVYILM